MLVETVPWRITFKKCFTLGFNDDLMSDEVERLVLAARSLPADS